MNFIKKISPFLLIILLSYFAIRPLLVSGFFPIHDNTQVERVFEMSKSLRDGMFPVRWVSDLGYGYGYPIFNFYAPLAYYVGGFLVLSGFNALTATKIMMGVGILFSGLFMYLFAKEFWGKLGGLVSAFLYLYAPYHAIDIYIRGDVAEFWAYAFIPFVFYAIFKSAVEKKWRYVLLGAMGFSGIILSHNLTALMATPFLFLFLITTIFIKDKNKDSLLYLFGPLALGVLLTAFYWLPVFFEMWYTNIFSQIGGGADFRDHFVCLNQLWSSPWGFGGSTKGCIDGISFKIGKLHLLIGAISFILFSISLFVKKIGKPNEKQRKVFGFFIFGFIISVFLMLESSRSIWELMPPMAFFQFPWRFLLTTVFSLSFISGFSVWFLQKNLKTKNLQYTVFGIIIFLVLIINYKLFNPQFVSSQKSADFTNINHIKWETSKISDEYMPKDYKKPEFKNEIVTSRFSEQRNVKLVKFNEKTQEINAVFDASESASVNVNIAYFPGWKVFVNGLEYKRVWKGIFDGEKNHFEITDKGFTVPLPAGKDNLRLVFVQTPIETLGNLLSLSGVFILILGIIYFKAAKK